MATATFDTYDATAKSLAEDVKDEIFIVTPVDSPIVAMAGTSRANATLHEWNEVELPAAGANRKVEGADASNATLKATTAKNNYTQIFDYVAQVSGTIESVGKYGRDTEMAFQLELGYGKIANDLELAVGGAPGGTRQTGTAGNDTTARQLKSLHAQYDSTSTTAFNSTNGVVVDDSVSGSTVAALESALLNAHGASYELGGNPKYLFTSPSNALYISQFAYQTGRNREIAQSTKLVNVIDLYLSPFGQIDVILDRNIDDVFHGLDFEYVTTPVLRPTTDYALAKGGDWERRQIIHEGTVALLNSQSGFMVDNVSTTAA